MLAVQSLHFRTPEWSKDEALAWASLHGFDHYHVTRERGGVRVHHRPKVAFDAATFRTITLRGRGRGPLGRIKVTIGKQVRDAEPDSTSLAYLDDERSRFRYEHYSRALRARVFAAGSRRGRPGADGNGALVRWYLAWFKESHPGAPAGEKRVAAAIARGLAALPRKHAREYVAKLGYRR